MVLAALVFQVRTLRGCLGMTVFLLLCPALVGVMALVRELLAGRAVLVGAHLMLRVEVREPLGKGLLVAVETLTRAVVVVVQDKSVKTPPQRITLAWAGTVLHLL